MQEKLKILKDILGPFYNSGQEYLFLCPYCNHHKKKFSINIEKNVYKCWVCDTRGLNTYQVVRKFGSYEQIRQWKILTNQVDSNGFEDIFAEPEKQKEEKIPLPKEFISLTNKNPSVTSVRASNYLKNRSLTKKDILRWKIGYCYDGEYGDRIIIPSFGMEGYANFFIARSYNNDWMRYKNPQVNRDIIFNELYVDWNKDIILVEGVFDAIRSYPMGSPIPLLGSTLRVESKLFQQIIKHNSRVYVALDADAQSKASRITQNLMKYGIETYLIDTTGYEDVAEIPKDIFQTRKQRATIMSSNNYLSQKIRSL